MEIEGVGSMAVTHYRPARGDVLVFESPQRLSMQVQAMVKVHLQKLLKPFGLEFGVDVQMIVVDGGCKLSVVRMGEAEGG